jgi:hypothetical protein
MANAFVAQGLEQLASAMVAGLYDGGVLVNTIYRDAESDLVVGKGDTVSIREPLVTPASNFGAVAVVGNAVEAKIAVPVNQQPYSQIQLTAKEKTLLVESLAAEVVMPQVAGIIEYIDGSIATLLGTTTGVAGATTALGWGAAVANARAVLTTNKVPSEGRYLACSPDVVSALLLGNIVTAWANPSAPAALAEGVVGRLFGFTVLESADVPAGTAFAYHRTGVAGVFRTPVPPEGGALVGSATLRGFSAQVIYAYDSSRLADTITAHTLYGLGTSDASFDERVLKVTLVP